MSNFNPKYLPFSLLLLSLLPLSLSHNCPAVTCSSTSREYYRMHICSMRNYTSNKLDLYPCPNANSSCSLVSYMNQDLDLLESLRQQPLSIDKNVARCMDKRDFQAWRFDDSMQWYTAQMEIETRIPQNILQECSAIDFCSAGEIWRSPDDGSGQDDTGPARTCHSWMDCKFEMEEGNQDPFAWEWRWSPTQQYTGGYGDDGAFNDDWEDPAGSRARRQRLLGRKDSPFRGQSDPEQQHNISRIIIDYLHGATNEDIEHLKNELGDEAEEILQNQLKWQNYLRNIPDEDPDGYDLNSMYGKCECAFDGKKRCSVATGDNPMCTFMNDFCGYIKGQGSASEFISFHEEGTEQEELLVQDLFIAMYYHKLVNQPDCVPKGLRFYPFIDQANWNF